MSEICCICLEKAIFFHKVNESVFDTVKCIEKLNTCFPSELWNESFDICNECVDKLDTAYSFIQLCLKSQQWRNDELLKHIKPLTEEIATDFTCHQCDKSFRLKRTLSLHITRIHTRPKKNVKKKLPLVKAESDVKNEIKVEHNTLNTFLELKEELESEVKNKVQSGKEKENLEKAPDISDFEDIGKDNDSNYSSEGDIFEEKKRYKGKKRGPKCKGPIRCEFCELVFARNDKHIQHVRSKHTFEKPFKCNLCDAKYFSQHNLKIHKRKHTNEKPYVCSTCGKSFISSNDLWQHNKIHEKVRQYACNECDRSFKTHSNLRTHKLQMHQDPGMWKFVCTVCGKKFPLNNNLVKHMRRHDGIKQFSCHLCHKKFVEKIDLQTHLLSHSDERLFKCNLCGKAYKKSETLRRHLKTEHDIGNFIVKKPEKKLCCPRCPKIFAFNNKLQRHILTHTGEKPVKCEYCEKRFRDNYDRNVHLRKDHDIEPKNSISVCNYLNSK